MSGTFRGLLLVAWAIFVAALVLAAAHAGGYRWNIIVGVAILGLLLFFRVSKYIYPRRPAPKDKDRSEEGK